MIDWPDDLIEDIARRKSVLFLGAGVSKNASNSRGEHPKDWEEFLTLVAQQVNDAGKKAEVESALRDKDFLTACELAKKFLRPENFKSALLKEYASNGYQPALIHESISRLDSRFVLTTNFDKLYETSANKVQQDTVLVKNYYDTDAADVFRRSQRTILKVHGSIDSPDKTIFTRSDYAKARIEHAHFYRLLESLFLTHTFIFLGASMRDPDIQILLEDYAYRFAGSRPHFMVMPEGSISAGTLDVIEDSMNLRAILYSPTNYHKELADSLADLVAEVEQTRNELVRTMDW